MDAEKELAQLSPEKIVTEFGKIRGEDNLRELCFSENKDITITIIIAGNEYCLTGNVFKYDIVREELDRANFADDQRSCDVSFFEFGEETENMIKLIGEFGDAGTYHTESFDYNFTDNTIHRR